MAPGASLRIDTLTVDRARELADVLLSMNADSTWDDWTASQLLSDRQEKWVRSLIAYVDERPVGWAVASRTPTSVHLHHLVVAPEMRGGGIGKELVLALLERNRDAGRFTLKVHRSNAAAARFYRRLGFTEEGTSPSGYLEFGRSAAKGQRVGVHQPNFAPWCGYFAKMLLCDAFVFFDDTQLPQGRSYVTRVKIARGPDADQWLSVPVQRRGIQLIRDASFAGLEWSTKQMHTLEQTYAKACHRDQALELVRSSFADSGSSLAEFNIRLIERIARYLGWRGTFHRSSDYPADLKADARIAQLVRAVGGDVYVSGAGGQKYQSDDVYAANGVRLEVRTYSPIPYERSGWPFVGGLSVLDPISHLGTGTFDVLRYASSG